MVDFHDRRRVALNAPKDAPDLSSGSGVFLSRKVINDCFVVTSEPVDGPLGEVIPRFYKVHEVLPDGTTEIRDGGFPTRYAAQKAARKMDPSAVRPLH